MKPLHAKIVFSLGNSCGYDLEKEERCYRSPGITYISHEMLERARCLKQIKHLIDILHKTKTLQNFVCPFQEK